MAYTVQKLTEFFTNANAGTAPTLAQVNALQALANQNASNFLTNDQAFAAAVDLASDSTTAVSVGSYQFFLGFAPSEAGLASLNAAYVGNGSQASLNGESRFIAQSISLALQNPTAKANFAASYGSLSVEDATKAAYNVIIGNAAAAAAGIDVSKSIAFLVGQTAYYTAFVKQVLPGLSAEDQALAVKAAIVGEILFVATSYNNGAGLGSYATASTALIKDLADDGHLTANNAAGIDLFGSYGSGGVGTTYTLTVGADTVNGTGGNDTIKALSVDATGAAASTLTSFDTIDGGAGTDTLNIYTTATKNSTFPSQLTVKNVEIVNIYNEAAAAALADVSKYQGVQELWQSTAAATVTNLGASTTAGFRDFAAAATFTVETTAAAASAKVALSNVAESSTVEFDGNGSDALASISLSGTVTDTDDDGTVADTNVTFLVGKDVTSVSVSSSVATDLTIDDSASADEVTTVDLSGSTGAITFVGDAAVETITGGSGKDSLTIATTTVKDDTTTAADETVSALVNSGAGNDTITVNTSGTGLTTINTGAGNDTVNVTARGATLVVNLGDGSDTFTSAVAITAADTIDAGAGTDTLALSLVGSANVGAFKNFDVFDVKGMTANLDLDILNTNNTVTELVGSGALGASVTVSNIATGVGFRATGDMGLANTIGLTQKTAGALTVTLDADQKTEAAGDDVARVSVSATAATSINTVFDTSYLATAGSKAGETAATDNVSTINLATQAATAVTVTSGGANAQNVLNITEGAGTDKLATVTVTGAQALSLSVTGSSTLATVDASGATGGLTFSLVGLKDTGTVKLGSGVDVITVTAASSAANSGTNNFESLQGFEKTAAVSVSVAAGDATAKAAAIADADKVVIDVDGLTNEAVANANGAATGATLDHGVLTFTGAGPATLDAAIAIADAFAETKGETVLFQYLGDSYVFSQGVTHANAGVGGLGAVSAADVLVKLTGVTGVTNLVETGTDNFFIV